MTVHMVRFTATPEAAEDVEKGVATLFAAVQEARPAGTRFRYYREAGGVSFVALLELDEGIDNPLPTIPAARDFQASLPTWAATPPTPEPLTLLASYDSKA